MTKKLIKYTLLALLLALGVILVNRIRSLLFYEKQSESSINQELPATISKETIKQSNPPTSTGNALIFNPYKSSALLPSLANTKDFPILTLGKANTLVFRDIVTPQSMGLLEKNLIEMSRSLPNTTPIYLVLVTPGGDIDAGSQFIDVAKAVPQEVKTITLFAASMGFHIVQNLGERLITPSGVLMSHRAAVEGIAGHVPGEAVVRLNTVLKGVTEMDLQVSKRVGMNLKDYQELVRDEYWVNGKESITDHMADKVVLVACGADLNETYTQKINTMFGAVTVEWSTCPVIMSPLNSNTDALLNPSIRMEDRKAMFDFINSYLNNKEDFIKKYILNDSYKKYIF